MVEEVLIHYRLVPVKISQWRLLAKIYAVANRAVPPRQGKFVSCIWTYTVGMIASLPITRGCNETNEIPITQKQRTTTHVHTMLSHDKTIIGLGDAGAHCGVSFCWALVILSARVSAVHVSFLRQSVTLRGPRTY